MKQASWMIAAAVAGLLLWGPANPVNRRPSATVPQQQQMQTCVPIGSTIAGTETIQVRLSWRAILLENRLTTDNLVTLTTLNDTASTNLGYLGTAVWQDFPGTDGGSLTVTAQHDGTAIYECS